MSKKGAIELSVNFLVVIIVSIVVVGSSLALFFKTMDKAGGLVEDIDAQTQDRIKDMMLSGNYPVLAYPQDPEIDNGESKLIGVGITNNLDKNAFNVSVVKITKYVKGDTAGVVITGHNNLRNYYNMSTPLISINPGQMGVKSILLKMPKNAENAQYVYTITVNASRVLYGIVQIYVTNP